MTDGARITIEPGKMAGRPCIRGLRIRVLDMLAEGAGRQDIPQSYEDLEDADIDAALRYARRALDRRVIAAE